MFKFCLENKIKLIYSTTCKLGNDGNDKNLYSFSKAKNLELLENLKNGLILNSKLFIFIMSMVQNKLEKELWHQLLEFSNIII